MTRSIAIALVSGAVLSLAACVGNLVDRDLDEDADPFEAEVDGGADGASVEPEPAPEAPPEPSPEDAGPEGDAAPEPAADADVRVPPVYDDCVEGCGPCTVGVDMCCGYSICQDDWSGETYCMPVVPPHSGGCPAAVPEPGSSCPEPGLLCRYDGAVRCKCGCGGWNCPYDG